jgi:branched-chain amino acid transport system substrate-binding protein
MPLNKLAAALAVAAAIVIPVPTLAADDVIRIASSLPLTGGSAFYGQQGRNGADLAVTEANAAGGVLGKKIAIDFWDNRCNPAEGVKSISQALAEKRYSAIHEGGCSSVALAVMPLAERAGVPFVVGSPTATAISDRSGVGGNKWTFKILPTDAAMLDGLVGWIATKGLGNKVAFIGEDTDYGRGGATGFNGALKKRGQQLVSQEFYAQGTTDFNAIFTRIRSQKPSLLAVYTIGADSQNFMKQWFEFGGGVGLTGRIFTDQIPKEILASGVLDGLTTIHPYDLSIDNAVNKDFVERYRKKFNNDPNLTSWVSYESARVIIAAVARAGSADAAAVRNAIPGSNFKTMFGETINFDDNNTAHLEAFILGVQKGKFVVLGKIKT